ncbi:hypothetical protein HOE04_00240 [archaeon]|mgnify:CR=1 FL=1|jgi:hypothetical protein|nr:hypothetical protein [archaeon]
MLEKKFTLDYEELARKDPLQIISGDKVKLGDNFNLDIIRYADFLHTFLRNYIGTNIKGTEEQNMASTAEATTRYYKKGFDIIIISQQQNETKIKYSEEYEDRVFEISLLFGVLNGLNKREYKVTEDIPTGLSKSVEFYYPDSKLSIFNKGDSFTFNHKGRERFYQFFYLPFSKNKVEKPKELLPSKNRIQKLRQFLHL